MPWDEAPASALLTTPSRNPIPGQGTEDPSQQNVVLRYEYRGAQVVEARGAYDMESTGPLAAALERAAETHRKVVLDASGVTFADSSFLNLMILTHRTGKLRVAAPSAQVRRLCEITAVDGVLHIHESVDDAVAA
ncbi:STAS domain-containing protein [Streptomyces sp. NPDC012769]|uniref:STAS domain-containing protein n=1 Tax=Streptomyces sp. NPDC012769 TaxID=3364848 RepID=UPI0036B0A7CB